MDFDIELRDVGVAVLQELWNKVTLQAIDLAAETKDVVLDKDSFHEFSRSIHDLSVLLQAINTKKVEAAMSSRRTKLVLESLNSQLKQANKIIKDYKSRSRLRLLLHSHSLLLEMKTLSKEIATTISSLQLVNLDIALNLKSKTDRIVSNLRSMEFQSAVETETIVSEIEKSITQNGNNQQDAHSLLCKIAEVVGASASMTLVQNELALLKQEKEEMEDQKKQAEALQVSQLIQLLYSTELVMSPQDEEITLHHQQYPIESFMCPLCNNMMVDPVAVPCGHSFERNAIEEYFGRGEKTCPICKLELPFTDLTPNLSLRSSIQEWKERDMNLKFQAAVLEITSNEHSLQNKALEELQVLMEMPCYTEKVAEKGLIPKFVHILKDKRLNSKAALKCLYYLAKYCDDHKEAIVEAGVIRRIVKQIYNGEAEPDAIAILLELSVKEALVERIGNTKDCIPFLVSLLRNSQPDISDKSQKVLQNLSSNTHFVVKMAQVAYFQPFVARFNQAGPQETRALMAVALINMQLNENTIEDLNDKHFIHNLVQMLSSSSPACKSATLKVVKKFIAHPRMVKQLLADPATIPHLLGLISFVSSDPHWKQEAAEILTILVGTRQFSDVQMYHSLQELQSQHNVSLLLQQTASTDPQTKVQFLQLLVELSHKSEIARNLVRSDKSAVSQFFSNLDGGQPLVRQWAMKLIYCVSEGHPAGVPLPPTPAKETAIITLAAIFTDSTDMEERSTAAGIISQLPTNDAIIDEILRKSETLKAIHEVICSTDDEHYGIKGPNELRTPLLENALAALLRYTEPTKPDLQRQVGKLELYPSLVRVLSRGSSLAKQRTATALAHLSQTTSQSISDANIIAKQASDSMPLLFKLFPNMFWCCSASSENGDLCSVHGTACSPKQTFCLVKLDALKPLVQTLSDTESGVAEAALMALETLLTDHKTLSQSASAIVDSQGVAALLQVLEKGAVLAKLRALDLLPKILKHKRITDPLFQRYERILIKLLQDDALKKKAALVLTQMDIIPEQSSYF